MTKFILIVLGLFIILYYPVLIVIVGVALLTWLFLKRPNSFLSLPTHLTTPEPKEEKSVPKKEHATVEEIYAREVEAKMKPGYKDDPKWQALSKKVLAHNAKQAGIDIKEDRLEALTDMVI